MNPKIIKALIELQLESEVIVEGEDGQHFSAIVISSLFEGKSRIAKQQLVYATLQKYIQDGSIHAISIKTFTPAEWANHG